MLLKILIIGKVHLFGHQRVSKMLLEIGLNIWADEYKNKKELTKFLAKNKNKKIVLCHGVFDLVHYGHILHFKTAKN